MVDRTIWFRWLQREYSADLDDPLVLLNLSAEDLTSPQSSVASRRELVCREAQRLRLSVRRIRPGKDREAWKLLLTAIDEAERFLNEQIDMAEQDDSMKRSNSSEPAVPTNVFYVPSTWKRDRHRLRPLDVAHTKDQSQTQFQVNLVSRPVSRRAFVWVARAVMLLLLLGSTGLWTHYYRLRSVESSSLPSAVSANFGSSQSPSHVTAPQPPNTSSSTTASSANPPANSAVAPAEEPWDTETTADSSTTDSSEKKSRSSESQPTEDSNRTTESNSTEVLTVVPTQKRGRKSSSSDDSSKERSPNTPSSRPSDTTISTNPSMEQSLRAIRDLMRKRNYAEAETQLDELMRSAQDESQQERIEALWVWNDALVAFWGSLHEIAAGLEPLDELPVRNTVALVVSASPKKLVLRVDGAVRTYAAYEYPLILIEALLNRGAQFDNDHNHYLFAAFLAADHEGDPKRARETLLKLRDRQHEQSGTILGAMDESYNRPK